MRAIAISDGICEKDRMPGKIFKKLSISRYPFFVNCPTATISNHITKVITIPERYMFAANLKASQTPIAVSFN